jgi:hypothetical protein
MRSWFKSLYLGVATALIFSASPSLSADCGNDNALACVSQALVKLQTAQDALSAARKDIADLQNQITALKAEISAVAQSANTQVSDLKKTIDDNAAKINFSIKDGASPESPIFGSVFGASFDGTCPAGQVLIGIKQEYGGTCERQCDGDGRPVRKIKVICGQPSLAH